MSILLHGKMWATFAMLALVQLLATGVPRCLGCETSHWEQRLNADLSMFEEKGITWADVQRAGQQVCGGYIVSINKQELYAYPVGWEATDSVRAERKVNPHYFLQMFTRMLCEYEVPDVTFVINVYDNLCTSTQRRPAPVFSWGKNNMNDDYQILVPYGIVFQHLNNTLAHLGSGPPWSERQAVAIWRGTTTGGTYREETWKYFPRARLVKACNNSLVCDAKFSNFAQSFNEAADAIKASGGYAEGVNMKEFLTYKYIIVNDGNMAPSSRLSTFMFSGSLILKQESPSIEFFYDDLQPYVHYVPLSYNFGDVEMKIKWARQHDKEVRSIVANALAYANTYFTQYNLNCFMYRLLTRYYFTQRFTPGLYNASWDHVPKQCGTRWSSAPILDQIQSVLNPLTCLLIGLAICAALELLTRFVQPGFGLAHIIYRLIVAVSAICRVLYSLVHGATLNFRHE